MQPLMERIRQEIGTQFKGIEAGAPQTPIQSLYHAKSAKQTRNATRRECEGTVSTPLGVSEEEQRRISSHGEERNILPVKSACLVDIPDL